MNLTTVINTIKYLRKIIWLLSGDDMLGLLFHFLDELLFLMCADPYFIVKVSLRYFSFHHAITNDSGYIHTRWMVNGKTVRDAWHLQLDSNKRHSWHCLIICHKYHPLSYAFTLYYMKVTFVPAKIIPDRSLFTHKNGDFGPPIS